MASPKKARSPRPRNDLTVAQVRSLFCYNKSTGVLRWKPRPKNRSGFNKRFAGKPAGTPDSKGHLQVEIYGVAYMAHRIIWLIVTGKWPKYDVDHKNRKNADNRWCNLRDANATQNKCNQKLYCTNQEGLKWVSKRHDRKNLWHARITFKGVTINVGSFKDPIKAHKVAKRVAKKLHGKFMRHC